MKRKKKQENVILDEDEDAFQCPNCWFTTRDFEESDQHFEEHLVEYQSEQDNAFGRYSE